MRVIGSLAALGLVAFALGAGAGLLWKDPGLVRTQWAGDTQEVAWSDPTAAADVEGFQGAGRGPLPDVDVPSREVADAVQPPAAAPERRVDAPYQTAAAEPVRPLAPREKAATAPPAAASERKATPAPPPAPRKETPHEEARVDALPSVSAPPPPLRGVAVQVGAFSDRRAADQLIARLRSDGFQAYASAAGNAWRVRVGPFRDRNGAEQAAVRLKRDQKLPTWVLEETGS